MSDPETITQADCDAALRVLRIDKQDLRQVTIAPGVITVRRHRTNADGNYFVAGKDPAETVTTIGITTERATT